MLLNSLPKSFESFKNTLMFGRQDQLSLDDIQTAIKTKFLQVKGDKKATSQRKNLNMKFKKERRFSKIRRIVMLNQNLRRSLDLILFKGRSPSHAIRLIT